MAGKGLSVDKAVGGKKQKKRETWSQTKRVGDKTEEIQVEKLDNGGYLITVSKSWYDAKREWHNSDSKLYSETNPLDKDETDNPIDQLSSVLIRKDQ